MASNYLSSATSGPSTSRTQPTAAATPSSVTSSSSAAQKPDRLYVGNLSPSVDEYALIQIFSKFGTVAKLDFLFHKSGPLRGKPRGFAFVEFTSKDDALKALLKLNDRMFRGRKLVVTYASQSQHFEQSHTQTRRGGRHSEAPRTTTLSLIKNQRRPQSAAAQIAALEAKLSAMQQSPLATTAASAASPSASASAGPSRLGSADVDTEGGLESGGEGEDVEMEMERLGKEVERDLEVANVGGAEVEEQDGGKGKEKEKERSEAGADESATLAAATATAHDSLAVKPPTTLPPRPAGLPPKPSAAVLQQSHPVGR